MRRETFTEVWHQEGWNIQDDSTAIRVTINGVTHQAEVEPRLLPVYFLREQLGLTGKQSRRVDIFMDQFASLPYLSITFFLPGSSGRHNRPQSW
jgi:hypothetical protein